MNRKFLLASAVLVPSITLASCNQIAPTAGLAVNAVRSLSLPPGTITTERATGAAVRITSAPPDGATDWPSYNRTLTGQRFSSLTQITPATAAGLHVLCVYDTDDHTGFETGPLVVGNALYATTEHDIFSIDPSTCKQNWRIHEAYETTTLLHVNRGAAYLDGRLFRGTQDGRVLAYDAATGRRIWATSIASKDAGETVPAAPVAWQGLVFIGVAGGDNKGVKGRMYALDAASGHIIWETYMVPKASTDPEAAAISPGAWRNQPAIPITGGATWTSYTLDPATGALYVPTGNAAPDFADAMRPGPDPYTDSVVVLDARTGSIRTHYTILQRDWHDWDVSTAPALIRTRAKRSLLAVAPKDGNLYGIDTVSGEVLYRTPATRIENADAQFSTDHSTHFCPGTTGGAEWNGPDYNPQTNLILVGEVDWCTSVTLQTPGAIDAVKNGAAWPAMATLNPYHTFGVPDATSKWGGWVYAIDADTGAWQWRVRSNYPVLAATTQTAGGVAMFGDIGGNFYILDAVTGERLWSKKLDGAIAGGVITYMAGGSQKIAVAAGFTSILWPTDIATGKIVVIGLQETTHK